MLRRLLFTFMSLLSVLAAAPSAWAHGVDAETDLALAQSIAGNDLTVVIRRADQVPGPIRVDVIAHQPVQASRLRLDLEPAAGGRRTTATVRLEAGRAGTYPATLHAERTGPHVLGLQVGEESSRLPFELLVPRMASWELTVYGAFGAASLLLIGALAAGALGRRIPAAAFGSAAAIAATVALTTGLLSPQLGSSQPAGRPYAQLAIETTPAPRVGVGFTLRLKLFDGATGAAVDDLVPHHGALTHLVVSSEDGTFFRHLHPARTGPGEWSASLVPDRGGTYVAHAEFSRAGAGGQLVSGTFTVAGTSMATAGHATPMRATAGTPVTIEVDAGAGVQPWLGMAGHLIVRDQSGDFLGHVHEQLSMQQRQDRPPDETVAAYGPTLRFTFSFPRPGRYFAWVQYVRDFEIVTVPYVVDVGEGRPEPEPVGAAGRNYSIQVGLDEAMKTATIQVEPDARTVDLSAVMPEMGHATPPVPARRTAPGRFEARADFFSMQGDWELSVRVTGAAGAEIITIPVSIDQ